MSYLLHTFSTADNTPKQCEDQYIVTIKTCDELDAGTDSKVSMVVYGSKGCTDELAIGPPKSEKFKPGSTEEFQVSITFTNVVGGLDILLSSHT